MAARSDAMSSQPPISKRRRAALLLAVVLPLPLALSLWGVRVSGMSQRTAALEAFEREVGPVRPDRVDPGSDLHLEGEMAALRRARALHERGLRSIETGELEATTRLVDELEEERRALLGARPRVVDLILSQAIGRMGLDLAASVVQSPAASRDALVALRQSLDPSADDLGSEEVWAVEVELFLAQVRARAPESLGDRLYRWLRGPGEEASAIRLYHGLAETMQRPILDVAEHLRRRTEPATLVTDMLIPNLRRVPLDHRLQVTSRRLVRLAIDARLAAVVEDPLRRFAASPRAAVTGAFVGDSPAWSFAGGSVSVAFSRAVDHQQSDDRCGETAPPSFPLALTWPIPTASLGEPAPVAALPSPAG